MSPEWSVGFPRRPSKVGPTDLRGTAGWDKSQHGGGRRQQSNIGSLSSVPKHSIKDSGTPGSGTESLGDDKDRYPVQTLVLQILEGYNNNLYIKNLMVRPRSQSPFMFLPI